jgi:hypothetical protein
MGFSDIMNSAPMKGFENGGLMGALGGTVGGLVRKPNDNGLGSIIGDAPYPAAPSPALGPTHIGPVPLMRPGLAPAHGSGLI